MTLIDLKQVMYITSLSRSHIYSEIKKKRFPRQRPYGKRLVRWTKEEVELWISDPFAWKRADRSESR